MSLHQRFALVLDDLQQRSRAQHAADFRFDQRPDDETHALFVAHVLIELQRIGDAVARVGVDDQTLLVCSRHFLSAGIEIEDTLVEDVDRIDDRHTSTSGPAP